MKKTISITLGGRAYIVEEDAYQVLDTYLTRLKSHFAKDPSVDELIADIELSISDKFSERVSEQKNVITEQDVTEIIAVMGQVNEIDSNETNANNQEKAEEPTKEPSTSKRLYRDEDDVVVAGVCSGLAAYVGVDPVFVRILFVLLAFTNGLGILAYLILWIAVPTAETSTQKLEMRGKPVNLTEIEELMKEKARLVSTEGKAAVERLKNTNSSFLQKILNIPVIIVGTIWNALQRLLSFIGPIFATLIGLFVILGSIAALAATSIVTFILLFRSHAPDLITDVPLTELAQGPWYYTGIAAFTCIVLVPLIFILTLGFSFLTRRNQFRLGASGLLLGLWIIAAGFAGAATAHLGPKIHDRIEQYRREQTTARVYDVKDFQRVAVTGNERLTIKRGDAFSVELIGLKSGLDRVDMKVENGLLRISRRDSSTSLCLFCLRRPIEGEITLPKLDAVTASGVSRVSITDTTDDLTLHVRDAASVEAILLGQHVTTTGEDVARVALSGTAASLHLTVKDAARVQTERLTTPLLQLAQEDVSRVEISGTTNQLGIDLKDAARLIANELTANHVTIVTRDNSRADIQVTQSLNATSSNVSRISYKGAGASTTLRALDHSRIVSSHREVLPE